MTEELSDRWAPRPVTAAEEVFTGRIWDVHRETVDLGEPGSVQREIVVHPGAVGVIALDEQDRVLLLRQYRHPVRHELWEPPAGLLDVDGEPALLCAQRELAEEADLQAERWHVLMDWFNTPGGSDESFRLFLARGLSEVPEQQRHTRTDEESQMVPRWVPLSDAHEAVLAGTLHNPTTVVGILAAHAARAHGWTTLRPGDAPWPQHKSFR